MGVISPARPLRDRATFRERLMPALSLKIPIPGGIFAHEIIARRSHPGRSIAGQKRTNGAERSRPQKSKRRSSSLKKIRRGTTRN
jgi:hypothetical protein